MTLAPGLPSPSASVPPADGARGYDRADWASAFRNVTLELTDEPLTVRRGAIPAALRGTLYRNGPGRLERGGQ
ncbi:MAG: carotenoid oxygenase family protein, partial [Cyanobacteriota bacterium]|nr:carotenoid oxygenase family protein [Cyanobacteriota bacterium]